MPLFYAPGRLATYAGVTGVWYTYPAGRLPHGHGLESSPVNTVSLPITLVVQVIPPITYVEMVWVDAATVMTAMANNLVAT